MAKAENNIAVSLAEAQVQRQNPHNGRPLEVNNDRQQLQQAMDLTRDTPIADMHYQDRKTLNKALHERTQLLATSSRFHYVKMANLFAVPRDEIRGMENAGEVLDHISRTQVVEITVAQLLRKLQDCGQCFDVVRQLSQQIIQRGEGQD